MAGNYTSVHHLQKKHAHRLKREEYIRILVLRTVGNFLIFSSIFMIVKTFYQPVTEEIKYAINSSVQKQYVVANSLDSRLRRNDSVTGNDNEGADDKGQAKGGLASVLNIKKVEVLTPQDTNFGIIIPKIGANARVIPNVNAADENEYLEALKKGVAHVQGSAFPGEGGHIYLFAHSTDYLWNVGSYNAVFYLLYKLDKNDEIDLFYKNQRYVYKVIDKQIVDPSQVEYITRKTNTEFLTMQTCWPPGTTLQRLLVFATRVRE